MNISRNNIVLGAGIVALAFSLGTAPAHGQTCVTPPTCEALGYTQTAAGCTSKPILKCPFDQSKVYCTAYTDETGHCDAGYTWTNGTCKKNGIYCGVGWIFYDDNTCSPAANYDKSKPALGVVVYVNPEGAGGQVMAPNPVGTSYWSTKQYPDYLDTPLPDKSATAAFTDYSSCSNTDILVNTKVNGVSYSAAMLARNYNPSVAFLGKWCLPAAGVLNNALINISQIDATITILGGKTLAVSREMWSSSERYERYAWYIDVWNYKTLKDETKDSMGSLKAVYPVMEY